MRPDLVSVVIPTLNEAEAIGPTLRAVARMRGAFEIIVVDAGSPDGTADVALKHGVRLVAAGPGRGVQMHAGAIAARGEAIWFLHADTKPPVDGAERVLEAMTDTGVVGGNFAVRFDGTRVAARLLTGSTRSSPFRAHLRRFGHIRPQERLRASGRISALSSL